MEDKDEIIDSLVAERDEIYEMKRAIREELDETKRKLNNIDALTNEIESLKKLLADREYIIEDLVRERDEISDARYAQRMRHEGVERKLREELEASTKRIDQIEHCKRMEDNDEIIDSLVAERDEICEEKHTIREELDDTKRKLKELEEASTKERIEHCKRMEEKHLVRAELEELKRKLSDENCEGRRKFQAEYKGSERTLKEFGDELMNDETYQFQEQCENTKKNVINSEQTKIKNEDGKETRRCNDSGIEIDLNDMTIEMSKRMDTMLEDKLSKIFMTGEVNWPNNLKVRDSSREEERVESINSNNTTTKTPERKTCVDPREQNVIIHGINEGTEVGHDAIYLKELFDILGMGHTGPIITHRLGMKKHDRPRPIKLTMKSINVKEQFMSKLGKLKFADDEFKRISVTDDYTIEEREEIRRWVKKANDKNDGMKDYVWKLRGTPKTGMRLVKICIYQ